MLAILSVILQTRRRFCIVFSRARNSFTLNMAEKDFPTSSDESDEDFVPEGEPSSDEGSSLQSEEFSDDDNGPKTRKRRKVIKKKSKLPKKKTTAKAQNKTAKEEDEEMDNKGPDIEVLWADFKKDVNRMEKKIMSHQVGSEDTPKPESSNEEPKPGSSNEEPKPGTSSEKPKPGSSNEKPAESKDEQPGQAEAGSAGNGDKGRKLPPAGRGKKLGLNKILEQLAKKEKMSTLSKSKLDWFTFKKNEGIEEELKTHNKGKDGYLEKQDFLQRTDLRQFEIEKQMRSSKRNQ